MYLLIGSMLSFVRFTVRALVMQVRCEPGTYMQT